MSDASVNAREAIPDNLNPLGMEGIEFIEYATSKQIGRAHV